MSPIILDGRIIRERCLPRLIEKIKGFGRSITLAIIQVGDRADSTAYIKAKKVLAGRIGIGLEHIVLANSVSESEILKVVQECNANRSIQGIIIQLPLPKTINSDNIIQAIDYRKDLDAITPKRVSEWSSHKVGALIPATVRGIRELLGAYDIGISSKNVVVVGRSPLVGRPIAVMCQQERAIVTVCHSQTINMSLETRKADILIVAVGKPHLITKEYVSEGCVVVDVGINRGKNGSLVGDVDFESVKNIVSAITPVPGGVGPMTVFALFENLLDLCTMGENKE